MPATSLCLKEPGRRQCRAIKPKRSRGPFSRQRLCLLQHLLHSRVLQIRRVAVFAKQAFHQHPHSGARRLAVHPIHRNAALDARHQFVRDNSQRGFAHDLPRALVFGKRVVKRDFFIRESCLLPARFIVDRGVVAESGPVLVRLTAQIASRFGVVVTQKLAAQAVPVIGALGGAAVNYAFIDHFQEIARAHFTVRRLERRYGKDAVRAAYDKLSGATPAAV